MSSIQIPNLTPSIGLDGTEQLEIVQYGESKRTTTGAIALLSAFDTSVPSDGDLEYVFGYDAAQAFKKQAPFGVVQTGGNAAPITTGAPDYYLSLRNDALVNAYSGGGVNLKNFGTPSGSDWSLVWENAVSSGETIIVPRGTFILEGGAGGTDYNMRSNLCVVGESQTESILKLADGANAHLLYGANMDDISISNLKLDGNKANQGLGVNNPWRGFYLVGNCSRIYASKLWVYNTRDHGFMLSSGNTTEICGLDSYIEGLYISDCGSQAHIDAGGPGGSGATGGSYSTVWIGINATGNQLNGMKTVGKMAFCNSYANGGGFETGFSTPEVYQHTYIGCTARNNTGDGWRNQGQGSYLTWIGGELSGNGQSGVSIFGSTERVVLSGAYIFNNGKSGVRNPANKEGLDGIFFGEGIDRPKNVQVSNCQIFDDQLVKTQEYAVYYDGSVKFSGPIVFDASNQVGAHKVGNTFASSPLMGDDYIRIGPYSGANFNYRNSTPVSATGSTSALDLMSTTIKANELPKSNILNGVVSGTVSGTNGTKVIRLIVGGASVSFSSQTAGETQEWSCNFRIVRDTSTRLYVLQTGYEAGGTSSPSMATASQSGAADFVIKVQVTLGNSADTVTQNFMSVLSE